MNNVVFRSPRQQPQTMPDAGEHKNTIAQDPAIILLAALGLSFLMLVMTTAWLLIQG